MATLFLSLLTKFLVFIFLAGIVGSAIVVIVTFIEDGQLLLERDEAPIGNVIEHADFSQVTAAHVGD
ncbi:MAG: hypothetical protein JWO13_3754 [Acidobacteriales bacterium]|nr:hypothetical protein [Terriglobales bacterium]